MLFPLPSSKLTWQLNMSIFNRKYIFKWSISIAMLVYQRVSVSAVIVPYYCDLIHMETSLWRDRLALESNEQRICDDDMRK